MSKNIVFFASAICFITPTSVKNPFQIIANLNLEIVIQHMFTICTMNDVNFLLELNLNYNRMHLQRMQLI